MHGYSERNPTLVSQLRDDAIVRRWSLAALFLSDGGVNHTKCYEILLQPPFLRAVCGGRVKRLRNNKNNRHVNLVQVLKV